MIIQREIISDRLFDGFIFETIENTLPLAKCIDESFVFLVLIIDNLIFAEEKREKKIVVEIFKKQMEICFLKSVYWSFVKRLICGCFAGETWVVKRRIITANFAASRLPRPTSPTPQTPNRSVPCSTLSETLQKARPDFFPLITPCLEPIPTYPNPICLVWFSSRNCALSGTSASPYFFHYFLTSNGVNLLQSNRQNHSSRLHGPSPLQSPRPNPRITLKCSSGIRWPNSTAVSILPRSSVCFVLWSFLTGKRGQLLSMRHGILEILFLKNYSIKVNQF